MARRERWLALATAAVTAGYFVTFRLGEERPSPFVSHDLYAEFYPNVLYALASVRDGGRGLLWNPFQNCGQPFFGMSDSGLLYPANLLFLVLDPGLALRGGLALNLVVAGAFTYALCRELGVGVLGAVGGALAFELGNACIGLTLWTPMAAGPFVWLPAAMLGCERILNRPSLRSAAALGVVLAVALLPGYPQPVFFICQLLALRVVWELATRRVAQPLTVLAACVLGLGLAPLLAAVQLLPALEVARESVRHGSLTLQEMSPQGFLGWHGLWTRLARRASTQPLVLAPCLLAAAAFAKRATRRHALFYVVAGTLYLLLALGPDAGLFAIYAKLPLGRQFHDPERFVWMTSFSLAILTALGLDAIASGREDAGRVARRTLVTVVVVLFVFARVAGGLGSAEWVIGGLAAGSCLAWALAPAARRGVAAVLLGVLLLNLVGAPSTTWLTLLRNDAPLFTHAALFERLKARMTPQDRIFIAHAQRADAPPFDLIQKTASLFRVPALFDYQPEIARRYAEFFVMLRRGQPFGSLNDVLFMYGGWFPAGFNRRLLDLAAGRYVVASTRVDNVPAWLDLELQDDQVRVYRNSSALERAFYVPRVEVVRDRDALLERLASGSDDLRQVAFLETAPPSAFTGVSDAGGTRSVAFLRNDPERITVHVGAGERGFLVLSDAYFPGWRATVDGVAAPILRADYAFRLVEVPSGDSVVEFRYAPPAVWIGAVVSVATLLAVARFLTRVGAR